MTIQFLTDGCLLITGGRNEIEELAIIAKAHPKAVFDTSVVGEISNGNWQIKIQMNDRSTDEFIANVAKSLIWAAK